MLNIPENQLKACKLYLSYFDIDGVSADQVVTEGELEIFHAIIFRDNNRLQILCSTQYGKSLFVALACIILTCVLKEVVCLVAPTTEKAKIMMRYYIAHLGDSPNFVETLEKNSRLDRLQLEESKDRIMLNQGGGIFIISANAGNSTKGIESAMGAGAKNVILDEAALIPDSIEATIFRMIAGKGEEAFYCKIGNPFYRNHFLASWNDPEYHKIFIDYHQGLREGRYNQKFIEEARKKPHFGILYECEFPKSDLIDDKGFIRLFTDDLIAKAQRVVEPFGEKRLGIDIAEGGGDYNTMALRWANYAMIVFKAQIEDTMETTGHIVRAGAEYDVFDQNWFIDNLGVGKGPYDRLIEQRYAPYAVRYSEKASDPTQFVNVKAEVYWALYKWLSEGGCLEPSNDWEELKRIKYKVDSSGRIQIQSKDDLRKAGFQSPDIVDALANTFARKAVVNKSREERIREKQLLKEFDSHRNKKVLTGSRYLRR